MARVKSTDAYTYPDSKHVWIPEARFTSVPRGACLQALRGHPYILAVMRGSRPLGWIQVDDVGFKSAQAFVAATCGK